MPRVMPGTGGRGTGGSAEGVVKAVLPLYTTAKASGEPDALKGARPVRRAIVTNA